jgi:hypothetical protein
MGASQSIENWVSEFKGSFIVKAFGAAFDSFSFLKAAYGIWASIFFPEPSTAELILAVKEEILREIRDVVAEEWKNRVDGLIKTYGDYVILHDPDLLDYLIAESNDTIAHLEPIIVEKDPRSAYLVAEAYNLLIPLSAVVILQEAAHQRDAGIPVDWAEVHQRNDQMFRRAIEVNKALLGAYAFDEMPNIPCYRLNYGKLATFFRDSNGDDPDAQAEYLRITEVVWQANERLRENTIEGYPGFWFTIERSDAACCLSASNSSPTDPAVRSGSIPQQDDPNTLWRLRYLRHDAARVVHWSGRSLTIEDLSLSSNNRQVRVLPSDAGGTEYDYEVFVPEAGHIQHYWRSWGDGVWRKGQTFGVKVLSAPAAFQNRAAQSAYNYEVFLRESNHIQHHWRSWQDGLWRRGQSIGAHVQSAPAAFQNGDPQSEYNYELFVREGNHIQHYWRSWQDGLWHNGASLGTDIRSAPTVFQNFIEPSTFNYELFAQEGDHIRHYWYGRRDGWHEGPILGTNIRSAPAAFQNRANGNYEVFVREGDHIQHYWRGRQDEQWHKDQSFGTNVQSAPVAFQNWAAESEFNYEVFVHEGDHIQHYWRSWGDGQWRKGASFAGGAQYGPGAFLNRDYRDGQLWNILDGNWTGRRGVYIHFQFDLEPPGVKPWYTYSKDIELIGREETFVDSNAYVPSPEMIVKFRASGISKPQEEWHSLQALNYPKYYIRHQNFRGKISELVSDLDKKDATFMLVPGLADETCVSFESVNYPGYLLRHHNFELYLDPRSSTELFKQDATFRRVPGLADPAQASFESVNYPEFFIRHRNFVLYLESGDTKQFRDDATFILELPQWSLR